MKMKCLFTGALALMMMLSAASAWAMSAPVYEIQPRLETLNTLSTAARDNWQVVDDSARFQISGDAIRVNMKSAETYVIEAFAGGDLYAAANADVSTNLRVLVEVQSDEPVQVNGLLKGREVFKLTSQGTGAYETLSASFELLPTDAFLKGSGDAEDFKIVFTGTSNSYFRNLQMRKMVEKQLLETMTEIAGVKADFDVSVYATEAGNGTVVLGLLTEGGESIIATQNTTLSSGKNLVNVECTLPESVNEDDMLVVYVKAEDGTILSERKQPVATFYANGCNLIGDDLKVKNALTLFGGGSYLVEFESSNDAVQVTLGDVVVMAENGVCELELTQSAIAALGEDANLSFDKSVSNVTLKKVADE